MKLREHSTQFQKFRAARALELKQYNAALMITKLWRGIKGRKSAQELKTAMEYYKSTGKDISTIPEEVKKMIHDKIAPYFSLKINNINTINSK